MRPLVAADFLAYHLLELADQKFARRKLRIQHHIGCRFGEAILIFARNYCGLAHGRMRDQCALDLCRTQPKTVDLKNIVRASRVPKISLLILKVLVARTKPVTYKSFFGFFVLVPVAGTSGVSFDKEVTNLVFGKGFSF